jgi:hydroxymethylglutaryl-CoA lyase
VDLIPSILAVLYLRKAIPQLADTKEVLKGLILDGTRLQIVGNCCQYPRRRRSSCVSMRSVTLVFLFLFHQHFKLRNTNSSIEQSLTTVEEIQNLCIKNQKKLVVYISMGFGNPYGDHYSEALLLDWVDKIIQMEVEIISLADTVGLATPQQVSSAVGTLIPAYPGVKIGVHLHSTPVNWKEKIDAALQGWLHPFRWSIEGHRWLPYGRR